MKIKRRICSVFLALCLCIGLMPMPALAADGVITNWNDLQAAIEGPETEVTVTISGDLQKQDDDRAIVIPAGKTVTLIGETGARIIRPDKSENGEFLVPDGAELTLSGDITVAGAETGGTPGDLSQANFVKVAEGGTLNLNGVVTAETTESIKGTQGFIVCEGAVSINDGAALSGWKIRGKDYEFASGCAALVVTGDAAKLFMDGGEVFGNYNTPSNGGSGAAIQILNGADFTMSGGSIHHNGYCDKPKSNKEHGGGIEIDGAGCSFTMTGGSITANYATRGAGVSIKGQAPTESEPAPEQTSFIMTGGSISGNVLSGYGGGEGGGVYAENVEIFIEKAENGSAPQLNGNKSREVWDAQIDSFKGNGISLYCKKSTLTMNGVEVNGNQMPDGSNVAGGAVYVLDSVVAINSSQFKQNTLGQEGHVFGGALVVDGASDVTIDQTIFEENTVCPKGKYGQGVGGAIFVSGKLEGILPPGADEPANEPTRLTITNSQFINNQAGGNGGAIAANFAVIDISKCSFTGNKQQTQNYQSWCAYGGGALLLEGCTATLQEVTFQENHCVDGIGGAIVAVNGEDRSGMVVESEVSVNNCTLTGNKADKNEKGQGGAIYVGSGTLNLEGNTVISNNAAMTGGAIVNEGTLTMDGGEITGNTATGTDETKDEGIGGGVANLGTFTMTGGKLYDNTAARGGNDFYNYAEKTAGGDVDVGIDDGWEGNHDMELDSLLPVSRAAAAHGTFTLRPAEDFGFDGWFEDAPGKRYPDVKTIYTPKIGDTDEKYLTIGEPTVQTVTVTFQPGDHGSLSGTTSYPMSAGSVFGDDGRAVPTVNANSNYEFTGWLGSDGKIYTNSQILALTIAGNMTFTAQYKAVSSGGGGSTGGGSSSVDTHYTLRYKSNGGTEYKDERYSKNTVVKLNKVPTREGYTFTGWYADKELTDRITSIKMTSDKTVYAGWEPTGVPEWLNGKDHFAYVMGYTDGTVRPLNKISRAEVATIFFRLLNEDIREKNLTTVNTFDDVNEGMWCNTAISTMTRLGVVHGRTAERFDPNAPITRAEFAAICARFDASKHDGDSNFTDISGHWAEAEIERAASLGWVRGYTDGTFRPGNHITRAEAMTMINRVLNRLPEDEKDLLDGMNVWPDNQPSDWHYLAVQEATNSHDFTRKSDAVHEHWTKLTADPDWSRYQ